MIDSRSFLQVGAGAGIGAVAFSLGRALGQSVANIMTPVTGADRLPIPAKGRIPVAFALSDNAVMIDFAGPWEVLQDVRPSGPGVSPFELFTVAETTKPICTSAGMRIVPDYTFENALTEGHPDPRAERKRRHAGAD